MPLVTFTIIVIEILAGIEIDIFTPSFPEIQSIFGLTPFMVELMLGLNFCAYTVSTLIVGNFGDKYGAKPIILGGLICFIIGSFFCSISQYYWQVLLGRVMQGLGIAGPSALAYVIIAEHYSVDIQVKIMGWLNGTITLAMACAPIIGSYVNLYFGWRGNFIVLTAFGIISLILGMIFIPESRGNKNISVSLNEYLPLFRSKPAFLYITSICFFNIPYWIFIGISPILYMDSMGVSLRHFGYYQGFIAFVFAVLSFSSTKLINIFGQKKCFYTSLIICLCAIIMILIAAVSDIKNPIIITAVLGFLASGTIIPSNILWPSALESVSNAKNRISAIMLAVKLILTVLGLQYVSYVYDGTFYVLGIITVFGISISLLSILILLKKRYIVLQ